MNALECRCDHACIHTHTHLHTYTPHTSTHEDPGLAVLVSLDTHVTPHFSYFSSQLQREFTQERLLRLIPGVSVRPVSRKDELVGTNDPGLGWRHLVGWGPTWYKWETAMVAVCQDLLFTYFLVHGDMNLSSCDSCRDGRNSLKLNQQNFSCLKLSGSEN